VSRQTAGAAAAVAQGSAQRTAASADGAAAAAAGAAAAAAAGVVSTAVTRPSGTAGQPATEGVEEAAVELTVPVAASVSPGAPESLDCRYASVPMHNVSGRSATVSGALRFTMCQCLYIIPNIYIHDISGKIAS
jgi:hypothetical protein